MRHSRTDLPRYAACLALVLALIAPAAHVLEIAGKARMGPELWLGVQQNLYAAFPVAGALGYVGAPLVCLWLAWAARGTREGRAALLAAGLVLVAFLSWAVVVAPVNDWIAAATPASLPPDWPDWRRRWEAGHALATALILAALLLVLRQALRRDPPAPQPASRASTAAERSTGQA